MQQVIAILNALHFALLAMLFCAVVFVILAIASYIQEELECHPAAKSWLLQTMSNVKDLKKAMVVEFPPLYDRPSLVNIRLWQEMTRRWTEAQKPKHVPRHARTVQGDFFEDGLGSFIRGFDNNGRLLEKRATRHASGQVMSKKYLKMHDLAPLGS